MNIPEVLKIQAVSSSETLVSVLQVHTALQPRRPTSTAHPFSSSNGGSPMVGFPPTVRIQRAVMPS
jgi:hypothetical protein